MTTPVTAEWFAQHGVPADQAAAYAEEHNRLAGMRPEQAGEAVAQTFERLPQPVPQPSTDTAPTDAQRARAEMDDIQRRRARGEISDYQWRREYEPKFLQLAGVASSIAAYEAALPGDQNAARVIWDADATQEAFERSIDQERSARSPADYQLPRSPEMSEDDASLDKSFREALHAVGAPIELGNHIGRSVNQTASELYAAREDSAAQEAILQRNRQALRKQWGSSFDARIDAVDALMQRGSQRSPAIKQVVEEHPELFTAPETMNYLWQLAQSQGRRGALSEPEPQMRSRERRRR